MQDVLERFAAGEPVSSGDLEYAARKRMTEEERGQFNGALLKRLHEAKEAYGQVEQRKDWLKDPDISQLVNTLVLLNEPFLKKRAVRHHFGHPQERVDDLMSTGLAGPCSITADVTGLMGAILLFTYQDEPKGWNAPAFTALMRTCIDNSFRLSSHDMQRINHQKALGDFEDSGEARTWVDRHQRRPENIVMDAELRQVLDEAIERLPDNRRDVARFIVEYTEGAGELPTYKEIGQFCTPQVSRERGRQLFHLATGQLGKELNGLVPEGSGLTERFREVFGLHRHQEAEVGG